MPLPPYYIYAIDSNGDIYYAQSSMPYDEFIRVRDIAGDSLVAVTLTNYEMSLYALKNDFSGLKWVYTTSFEDIYNIVINSSDNVIFSSEVEGVPNLICLDKDGNTVFTYIGYVGFGYNSIVLGDNDEVYCVDSNGVLHHLDSSGNLICSLTPLSDRIYFAGILNKNNIYITQGAYFDVESDKDFIAFISDCNEISNYIGGVYVDYYYSMIPSMYKDGTIYHTYDNVLIAQDGDVQPLHFIEEYYDSDKGVYYTLFTGRGTFTSITYSLGAKFRHYGAETSTGKTCGVGKRE